MVKGSSWPEKSYALISCFGGEISFIRSFVIQDPFYNSSEEEIYVYPIVVGMQCPSIWTLDKVFPRVIIILKRSQWQSQLHLWKEWSFNQKVGVIIFFIFLKFKLSSPPGFQCSLHVVEVDFGPRKSFKSYNVAWSSICLELVKSIKRKPMNFALKNLVLLKVLVKLKCI